MNPPNFIILYVDQPLRSAAFYSGLLGCEPVQSAPTFVLFKLSSGMMLGLWVRQEVLPAANVSGGGTEIVFNVKDVDAVYSQWRERGLEMLQHPTQMDFGYTFVAQDPDGHRLRVYSPSEG